MNWQYTFADRSNLLHCLINLYMSLLDSSITFLEIYFTYLLLSLMLHNLHLS